MATSGGRIGNAGDEERAELLKAGAKNDITDDSSESDNDMPGVCDCDMQTALGFLKDLAISSIFWYVLCTLEVPDQAMNYFLLAFAVCMLIWRIYRAFGYVPDTGGVDIPYTAAYFASDNKEMYIVATVHISPRAPKDVLAVMESVNPDVAMIELDEERLDRMRDPDEQPVAIPEPKPEDLQPITVTRPGMEPIRVLAQRANWNAEWASDVIRGSLIFDESNAYAMCDQSNMGMHGSIALVKRGSADGEWAPFMLKAHNAYKCGAQAVLVVSGQDRLPINRIGGGSGGIQSELKIAWRTKNCGFPPVPLLLLPQTEGERLETLCREHGDPVSAEFTIMQDHYPRRTLRLRLCQACSLLFTGIGVLYGIIGCFQVEVGAEFTVAEIEAKARGIPCACIDVDLNRFWNRLGGAIIPTPCNLLNSFWCWMAFPRVLWNVLFPPLGNVDVMGGMMLHAASFPLRTWVAFILAGFCASQITSHILALFGWGASKAVQEAGGVESEKDRDNLQQYIMLGIQMYILPQVYTAIAASRDEAMYQMIVKKSRVLDKKRMVVVVGAAHSNGILQRCRSRGL